MKNKTTEDIAQHLWGVYIKSLFGDEKFTADWEMKHHQERSAWMDMAREARICLSYPELIGSIVVLESKNTNLLQELRNIANANTAEWDDRSEFESWVKSRARSAYEKATGEQP